MNQPRDGHRRTVEQRRRIFVIHGRDERNRKAMFIFLRSVALEPLEWSEAVALTRRAAPYVGEVLDAAFTGAQAVVALFTGDDEARLRPVLAPRGEAPERPAPQARPNVLFEAGMAMGRNPRRTVFVEIGALRPFSDLGGRHVIRFDGSARARQALAQRLESAGCAVNLKGSDWLDAGDFDIA
jgi:predicted nucleotide-binding protein